MASPSPSCSPSDSDAASCDKFWNIIGTASVGPNTNSVVESSGCARISACSAIHFDGTSSGIDFAAFPGDSIERRLGRVGVAINPKISAAGSYQLGVSDVLIDTELNAPPGSPKS